MSWGGGNLASGLGFSDSNSLVRMGIIPTASAQGILAPGMGVVTEDIPKLFAKPDMPSVAPAPVYDNSSEDLKNAAKLEAERLRKRKGMKSTILTGDTAMLTPANSQKAELLGG